MIPRSADWKNALATAVRDPAELLALLELPRELLEAARQAAQSFPLRVPRGFVALMEKGNPHDPLLRQVLPLGDELSPVSGYSADPLFEQEALACQGLLHKYHGRALLVSTGACAVHCRYCFRRHFPYGEENPASGQWGQVTDYLSAHHDIEEVILSGGDPLVLDDGRLADLAKRLEVIPHLKRLRIHSRLPVMLPQRVDDRLLEWVTASRLQAVMVIHCNHPNELGDAARAALERLHQAGIPLLNQAVLLSGINDDVQTLAELSNALFESRVFPYYLHLLDRVQGAAHFEVDEARAIELMDRLRARLPGYLLPRLVRELPGDTGKQPIPG